MMDYSTAMGLGGMGAKCKFCGLHHQARCPQVKVMEFSADGELTRVEFFGPNELLVNGWFKDLDKKMWPQGGTKINDPGG